MRYFCLFWCPQLSGSLCWYPVLSLRSHIDYNAPRIFSFSTLRYRLSSLWSPYVSWPYLILGSDLHTPSHLKNQFLFFCVRPFRVFNTPCVYHAWAFCVCQASSVFQGVVEKRSTHSWDSVWRPSLMITFRISDRFVSLAVRIRLGYGSVVLLWLQMLYTN